MYSCILTELGITIFDNQTCVKIFSFENPAEEYVLVKKGQANLNGIGKFLTNNDVVIVNDHGLLDILKKKSKHLNGQVRVHQDVCRILRKSAWKKISRIDGF